MTPDVPSEQAEQNIANSNMGMQVDDEPEVPIGTTDEQQDQMNVVPANPDGSVKLEETMVENKETSPKIK